MSVTDQEMDRLVRAVIAKEYHDRGWRPFPWSNAKDMPLVAWSKLKQVAPSDEEVEEWFARENADAIVVITGMPTGIIGIDIDRHGDEDGFASLDVMGIELPDVPMLKTPRGGVHFLAQHPGGFIRSGHILPGVEVKGDKGDFEIGGDSIKLDGDGYEWTGGSSPYLEVSELPTLNGKLGELITSDRRLSPRERDGDEDPGRPLDTMLEERMASVSTIDARPQEWLQKYWLPLGELTVLAGWGDQGKSQIAIDYAARLSRGELEGGTTRAWRNIEPGVTLYLSAEDNPETTIAGRWMATKGATDGMRVFRRPPGSSVMFPDRVSELRDVIRKYEAKLVILDPILAFVPTIYDSHKDQDTRNVLAPLTELAQSEKVAILFIMHLNKGSESSKLISRLSGSTAWGNAARSAWGVGEEPSDDGETRTHLLYQMKHNLGPETNPLRYRIVPDIFKVEELWVESSHIDWMGEVENADLATLWDGNAHSEKTVTAETMEAFHEILKEGPKTQKEVMDIAKNQMGIDAARSTWYNAKGRCKIASIRRSDEWEWVYPGHGHLTENTCPVCR
jgi:hypothetical protein